MSLVEVYRKNRREQLRRTRTDRPDRYLLEAHEESDLLLGVANWITGMRFPFFGTLTLENFHGVSCRRYGLSKAAKKRAGVWIPCGNHATGCFVPGVQASERYVSLFLASVARAVVVEEFGRLRGRRHFHFVADGDSDAIRDGWDWGVIQLDVARSMRDTMEYVHKHLVKDLYRNDGQQPDGEHARWWLKLDVRPSATATDDGADVRSVGTRRTQSDRWSDYRARPGRGTGPVVRAAYAAGAHEAVPTDPPVIDTQMHFVSGEISGDRKVFPESCGQVSDGVHGTARGSEGNGRVRTVRSSDAVEKLFRKHKRAGLLKAKK